MKAEKTRRYKEGRQPLTILISPEVWEDLDDAALGRPPYPRTRYEKSSLVEEALRQYLPTLRLKPQK